VNSSGKSNNVTGYNSFSFLPAICIA